MLIVRIILALLAVGGLRGRSSAVTAAVAAVAIGFGVAPFATLRVAIDETVPIALFLTAAMWLAAFAASAGLSERLAGVVARAARGSGLRLYVLVCALCALLTATVSLDGAVVLMVPLL